MPLAEPTTCDACGATHRLTDLWMLARPNGSSVYVCDGCRESTP